MSTLLDRIDDLSSRPPAELSDEEERELVLLRRRAFDELPRAEAPNWPPAWPDPAPKRPGLLSIGRGQLALPVVAGALQHRGVLHVKGLLRPRQVERVLRDLDRAFRSRGDTYGGSNPPDRWYHRFEEDKGRSDKFGWRHHVRLCDTPRGLGNILGLYRRAGLVDVIAEYLGERPALSVNKSSFRRVQPSFYPRDYHQDGAFLGADIRTVNVWLALTDCGVDAPGLDFIPARMPEILPTGEGSYHDWAVAEQTVDAMDTDVIRPPFAAGDALLFDQMLLHRTGNSEEMPDDRLAIESWFFAPSHFPEDHCPLVV